MEGGLHYICGVILTTGDVLWNDKFTSNVSRDDK